MVGMASLPGVRGLRMRMIDGKWVPGAVAAWVFLWVLGMGQVARASEAWAGAHPRTVLGAFERRQVSEEVHEYSFRVRVGNGAHDVITLHRVVREMAPWVPARTEKAVFLVHGDMWGFRGAFLTDAGRGGMQGQSFAVYLARQGVDVWGIDLRWVHVPEGTRDFSFMKDWNLGLHARDVGTGLSLARLLRALWSSGSGKMALLGWSRGAAVSYAWLNEESRWPPELRHVSAFIPVDMAYKLAPEDELMRQEACGRYAALSRLVAEGKYESGEQGLLLQYVGAQALSLPDEPSFRQGFSNRQLALLAGGATWALQPQPFLPTYHFTGGRFDASNKPLGLTWTPEHLFLDFLLLASPYQSLAEQVDTEALWCDEVESPYDDHLDAVTVPVLYVGASGGFGRQGLHALTLLGSTDVSTLVLQRFSEEARELDYGHADLFLSDDAETSVWAPLLEWLGRH